MLLMLKMSPLRLRQCLFKQVRNYMASFPGATSAGTYPCPSAIERLYLERKALITFRSFVK